MGHLRARSDNETGKLVPSRREKQAILCFQPRLWNRQSLRPPPRFSLATLFALIVLAGPRIPLNRPGWRRHLSHCTHPAS
jgi:hypothetical protein